MLSSNDGFKILLTYPLELLQVLLITVLDLVITNERKHKILPTVINY